MNSPATIFLIGCAPPAFLVVRWKHAPHPRRGHPCRPLIHHPVTTDAAIGDDVGVDVSQPGQVSQREAEVLAALGERLSNAQIAARLYISVRTVESHVSALLRKYQVGDRQALAEIAGQGATAGALPGRVLGVPAERTSFVGRGWERDRVLATFEAARLVTLLGPGGVGKTRLAVVIAGAAAPLFPTGGAFVDLVPVRDGFVGQAVAAVLGVTEAPQQPLEDAIAARLGRGRWLLVLDNCEHLVDAAAGFAERLLSVCPGTRILVTSRERLGVPGERVVPIGPLPIAAEAVTLFTDRVTAVDPQFTADPAVVGELCARLDGMPLAIELAAARGASLGASGLLAALDDTLRLVAGGRGADARHRSLRTVIGWSYQLLDVEEQRLFRRLAVFAGSFDLPTATAVTGIGDQGAVADVLGRLVDKSLLIHRRGATSRWRLLETIRAFALEQLQASGEHAELAQQHLGWAAATAVDLESRLSGPWRDEFDAVADDLRAALAAAPPGPDPMSYGLAKALGHLIFARRFLEESVGHYERAAEHATSADDAARALRNAADCAYPAAPYGQRAIQLLLASAASAGEAGNTDLQAITLARAVEVATRFRSGLLVGIPHARLYDLLDQARSLGDPTNPAVAAGYATAAAWAADPDSLIPDAALAQAATEAARSTGDAVLISASLDAVRAAASAAGRLREALRVSTERLDRLLPALSRNDPYPAPEIADIFHMACSDALAAGDLPAAIATAREVQVGDLADEYPYVSTGTVIPALVLAGEADEALRHADAMWDGWQRLARQYAVWISPAVSAVALAHGLLGNDQAFTLWRARAAEVVEVASAYLYRHVASFLVFVDARLAIHTLRLTEATALVERAFAHPPRGWCDIYARAAAAELAVVAGLPDAAQRLASAAPAGEENLWAAACLARAAGRLDGDTGTLATSIDAWGRIGSRFERACTMLLLTELAEDARAELTALGLPPPRAQQR
jgi:predicted ATPase/DNA-binding CsgD family transcriptional regulator